MWFEGPFAPAAGALPSPGLLRWSEGRNTRPAVPLLCGAGAEGSPQWLWMRTGFPFLSLLSLCPSLASAPHRGTMGSQYHWGGGCPQLGLNLEGNPKWKSIATHQIEQVSFSQYRHPAHIPDTRSTDYESASAPEHCGGMVLI